MQLNTEIHHAKTAPLIPCTERFIAFEPEVALLNFDKLKWKLTKSSESSWSDSLCDFAECEYR